MPFLELKLKLYDYLLRLLNDDSGFILSDTCDCLLFSCLVGSIPGYDLNVDQCYGEACDMWFRRPIYQGQCCPKESKSSISRDMLLGLAWYCFYKKRLDISEGIIRRAKNSFGKMGFSDGSFDGWNRTMISPGLLSTFAWVSYRLGGPSRSTLRKIPPIFGWRADGYQAHLLVIHALLRTELEKTDKYDGLFHHHFRRQNQNPLFAFASGHLQSAYESLMNEAWWPKDRLPNTDDRRGEWILQRDWGRSWRPSGTASHPLGYVEHSGGDFIFAAALVLGMF